MTKLKRGLAYAFGAILVSSTAFAGLTRSVVVDIDLDNNFASGDMITARTAKDDTVFIGCGTRNTEDGSGGLFSWAFCQGEDRDGDSATCFTFNPDLVKTVREINSNSFITFSWTDDGAGNLTCTRMGFSTQSFYMDKHTKGNLKKKDN